MDFVYVASTSENRVVNGSLIATDEKVATEHLNKQGYRVLSLKVNTPFNMDLGKFVSSGSNNSKVKTDVVVALARQMATLIHAGVNIITSLELLQVQTVNIKLKSVLSQVVVDVKKGLKLSDAMKKHPKVFPPLFCRLLSVGEQSGEMGKVLNQVADYMEKGATARKSLKGALTYPMFIILVAVVVIAILVTFVFPTFIGLYQTMGAQLPILTRIVISVVNLVKAAIPYVAGIAIIAGAGLFYYVRKPTGRYKKDKFLLKLPILGRIIQLRELAISCQTMSLLFRSGLSLADIMDVIIESCGNSVITQAFSDIKKSVFKGEGLSEPMSKNPVFLPMMVEMVKVGEETGEMDSTLLAVAQNYNAEADNSTHTFIAVLQPALTLVIGVVVAVIVLSMMSLMYSIYGQIKT